MTNSDELKKGIKELRTLYNEAVKNNQQSFLWQDQEVYTLYAKYLLEYYEPKFQN